MTLKPLPMLKDGMISLGTHSASLFGFTANRFREDSYLWRTGDYIYISLIFSKTPGRGHLSTLFNTILGHGFGIKVPNPLGHMEEILRAKGFTKTTETSRHPESGQELTSEVWVYEALV